MVQDEVQADKEALEALTGVADMLAFTLGRCQVLLLRQHARALEEHGLDERQYTLLRVIAAGEHRSQRDVGAQLYIDRTTIVALIDQLQAKGLVERQRSDVDRRQVAVGVTSEGRRQLDAMNAMISSVDDQFLAPLSASARTQVRAALRLLAAHHSALAGETVGLR